MAFNRIYSLMVVGVSLISFGISIGAQADCRISKKEQKEYRESCLSNLKEYPDQFFCTSEGELPYGRGKFSVKIDMDMRDVQQFKVLTADRGDGCRAVGVRYVFNKRPLGFGYWNYPNVTFICEFGDLTDIRYEYDSAIDVVHSYPASCDHE